MTDNADDMLARAKALIAEAKALEEAAKNVKPITHGDLDQMTASDINKARRAARLDHLLNPTEGP